MLLFDSTETNICTHRGSRIIVAPVPHDLLPLLTPQAPGVADNKVIFTIIAASAYINCAMCIYTTIRTPQNFASKNNNKWCARGEKKKVARTFTILETQQCLSGNG